MKQYLITGVAALALTGMFTSCSNDDEWGSLAEAKVQAYEEAFVQAFGMPNPQHNWGFGPVVTTTENARKVTRAIDVNGDLYAEFNFPTTAELEAAYPTTIPANPEELAANGNYDYYFSRGEGHNFVISHGGEYTIGGSWMNLVDDANALGGKRPLLYNIYINTDEPVTLTRNGDSHFNLYVMRGEVTLGSNFGEKTGLISVYDGAILYDQRSSIACNYGTKLYNRGMVIAGLGAYDIGNQAMVYNEGQFIAQGDLSYSPGAGNTSFFYNRGDNVQLSASSMTLNSTCHFFTDGQVNITGATTVTQSGIVWVNNGHYTTGTMKFSAQNGTFYNYCQLVVEDNCWFLDGQFNMMEGSYAEFGTGMFDNFHVNMYNNSGVNILNGSKYERQGAGIQQGFFAVDDNAVAFVRLGGETSIPAHKGYAFQASGANLTIAYENVKFYNNYNNGFMNYGSFSSAGFWDETNAEKLANIQSENGTWDLGNAKTVSGENFSKVTVSKNSNDCAATWNYDGTPDTPPVTPDDPPVTPDDPNVIRNSAICGRVFCEDMAQANRGDIDFNDVVFDAYIIYDANGQQNTEIHVLAAGGTLPITVAGVSIHDLFNHTDNGTMINTVGEESLKNFKGTNYVEFHSPHAPKVITKTNTDYTSLADIPIQVQLNDVEVLDLTSQNLGDCPHKICVPIGTAWPQERIAVSDAYTSFRDYVTSPSNLPWDTSNSTKLYTWNYTDDSMLAKLNKTSWDDVPLNQLFSTVDTPAGGGGGGNAVQLWPANNGTGEATSEVSVSYESFDATMTGKTLKIYAKDFNANSWQILLSLPQRLDWDNNFAGISVNQPWNNNHGSLAIYSGGTPNGSVLELPITEQLLAKFMKYGITLNIMNFTVTSVKVE